MLGVVQINVVLFFDFVYNINVFFFNLKNQRTPCFGFF